MQLEPPNSRKLGLDICHMAAITWHICLTVSLCTSHGLRDPSHDISVVRRSFKYALVFKLKFTLHAALVAVTDMQPETG
jgi:hypothetical protein